MGSKTRQEMCIDGEEKKSCECFEECGYLSVIWLFCSPWKIKLKLQQNERAKLSDNL